MKNVNERSDFSGLASFQSSVTFHIETSHLIYTASKMADFHTGLKWF